MRASASRATGRVTARRWSGDDSPGKTFRTSSDTHELLLVTDRLDLAAELIVLL